MPVMRWDPFTALARLDDEFDSVVRRTFQLPGGVTADQVEAESDNGMLRLRIRNVTKPVLPPQKVTVRAADAGQQRKTIEATPPKQS